MLAGNFSLRAYLARIGYDGPLEPTIDTVCAMMRRQLRSVPFENLDVQAGKVVSLVAEDIVEKIIERRRGGYCYEVNGIFAMALQALGVPYRFVAARPMTYPQRRPRTHMALVVTLGDERWLCDLGFGSHGIRAPINLSALDTAIAQDTERYSLASVGPDVYLLRTMIDGNWANQYEFDLSAQEWVDFIPANYLNSTHPESIFVKNLIVVQQTDAGRKILFGDTFKVIAHGLTEQHRIAPRERDALIEREFGLTMPR